MPELPRAETAAQKLKTLRLWYRETFKTDEDLAVLFDILNECGFMVSDPAAVEARPGWSPETYVARHSLAIYILNRIGALQEFNGVDILHALKKLPYEKES